MEIYWLTRLAALKEFCEFGLCVSFLYFAACVIVTLLDIGEFDNTFRKARHSICRFAPWVSALCGLLIIGCVMLPTKKDIYLILGKGYVDRVVEMVEQPK